MDALKKLARISEPDSVDAKQLEAKLSTFLTQHPGLGLLPQKTPEQNSLLDDESPLLVGLSGGVDSIVILHALYFLLPVAARARLIAVHVNHGLSKQADEWADFCKEFCKKTGIAIKVINVKVSLDSGEGIEAAARRARYGAFAQFSEQVLASVINTPEPKHCALFLAHHRNDQAETILFNLLRGTGLRGAAGMLKMQLRNDRLLVLRPLLDVSQDCVLAYAKKHQLKWVEDESNQDSRFTRNFLRHQIMPLLVERFAGVLDNLLRHAQHCAESEELLSDLAVQDLQLCKVDASDQKMHRNNNKQLDSKQALDAKQDPDKITTEQRGQGAQGVQEGSMIDLAQFRLLSVSRQKNLLRYWFKQHHLKMLSSARLAECVRQLGVLTPDNHFVCPLDAKVNLRLYRNVLYLSCE